MIVIYVYSFQVFENVLLFPLYLPEYLSIEVPSVKILLPEISAIRNGQTNISTQKNVLRKKKELLLF